MLPLLALFLSSMEESGLLLLVHGWVCRRTRLPPRGWARPEAKEEVLQHLPGRMGLAVSAWHHFSSCYHHKIQEKGFNSNQMLPRIPIPNGGQWMFLSPRIMSCITMRNLYLQLWSLPRGVEMSWWKQERQFSFPLWFREPCLVWIWTFCSSFISWGICRRNCGEFIFHRSKPSSFSQYFPLFWRGCAAKAGSGPWADNGREHTPNPHRCDDPGNGIWSRDTRDFVLI